ncbi:hypothetical protein D3C83_114870 [compost metagenome]
MLPALAKVCGPSPDSRIAKKTNSTTSTAAALHPETRRSRHARAATDEPVVMTQVPTSATSLRRPVARADATM